MTDCERCADLVRLLQSERKRWSDLRKYAAQTSDTNLSTRMDQATAEYVERNQR